VSLGRIDLELYARTEGLRRGLQQYQGFHNQVSQSARKISQEAQAATAAFTKQEAAIRRAFQQTLNLQQKQRATGDSTQQIGAVTRAFNILTKEMSSGQLTALQYQRVMGAFNARMGEASRQVLATAAANKQLALSSATAEAASNRQATATARAFQQMLNLQQRMQVVRASPAQIQQVANAYNQLSATMRSGTLTTAQYNQAIIRFKQTMGTATREVNELTRAMHSGRSAGRFNEIIRDLQSASVLAIGPLSGLGARIGALAAITSRSTLMIAGFLSGIAAAVMAVVKLGTASIQTGLQLQQMMARFTAATGSTEQAGAEFDYLMGVAKELGLRVDSLGQSYSRLTAATMGTSMEGENTRQIFEGISQAAAALRMDTQSVEGTFRAIEQMISKGTVQAEELRGQLGERLPGAFRIAAESMGYTTRELGDVMKAGELTAEEFLTHFIPALKAAFGKSAQGNVRSLQGEINNLSNAAFEFTKEFGELLDVMGLSSSIVHELDSLVSNATESIRSMKVTIAETKESWDYWVSGIKLVIEQLDEAENHQGLVNFASNAKKYGAVAYRALELPYRLFFEMATLTMAPGGWTDDFKEAWSELNYEGQRLLGSLQEINLALLPERRAFSPKFGEQYKEVTKDITKLVTGFEEISRVMDKLQLSGGAGGDFIMAFEKYRTILKDFKDHELRGLATNMAAINPIFIGVKPTVDSLATAFANLAVNTADAETAAKEIMERIPKAQEEFRKAQEKAIKDAAKLRETTFKSAADDVSELVSEYNQLTVALNKVSAAGGANGDFVLAMEAYKAALSDSNLDLQRLRDHMAAISPLFAAVAPTVEAMAEAMAKMAVASSESEDTIDNLMESFVTAPKAISDATAAIEELRSKLVALKQGPDALEEWDRVNEVNNDVKEFTKTLEDQGVARQIINEKVAEYKDLLTQVSKQEAKASEMVVGFARSMTDALESVLMRTKSFSNAIKDLEQALIQIMLRAVVLKPFEEFLTNIMSGKSGGTTTTSTGGGGGWTDILGKLFKIGVSAFAGSFGGGGTGYGNLMTSSGASTSQLADYGQALRGFANEGAFRVGGSGGADSQLVAFRASPNEEVAITKPSQRGDKPAIHQTVNFYITSPSGKIDIQSQNEIARRLYSATSIAAARFS